ncbi:Rid family detoxifying hydrolase [Flavobacteriales bacterium]|jgi:2-iminobutanoate/2-iminopropanoate deaminase|nr:Rid family detoxifying hydrolase [Flavobacteriales bacterium]MDB9932599.1 Rid family detoxifying hydrolase [Flavobacteriales bacterium]MDC0015355.1 Rid family detoxifying hydrolase [Flavobacteriales bacterium]MDC1370608.1 Rid family detoxifying hydrolase [Flavobacteriales bacterium]MDG1175521.1 Rid family detoxifying hydrolase [Flavobacteriales bacterium]|tara:strand:+ start:1614 stop:1994 length:381 start_codon:yes stop_codon:yes gene_type:complete
MKKSISIQNAPAPVGSYSQAILSNDTLYISGQIAINPFDGEFKTESIETETHQVMKNILALLDAAEMDVNNLVKCSIFLDSMDNFGTVDGIYSSYFEANNFPARETVEVSKLPKGVRVEISAIAVI